MTRALSGTDLIPHMVASSGMSTTAVEDDITSGPLFCALCIEIDACIQPQQAKSSEAAVGQPPGERSIRNHTRSCKIGGCRKMERSGTCIASVSTG